ncbi:MAG: DUF3426 domain-containing protein [Burkholderiaceae bacterium]|nr:DUF3426 domain-containing protein [Burkholderiaceae bacterium]MDP1968026.1 DUF3426 domain-containing protein [Burkholderiaceae bacterium]
MSLITRCPACGTMFKVVPDQLRISEGWVRCGHCSEVFDASAHIQDEPSAVPQPVPQPVQMPSPVPPDVPASPPAPVAAEPTVEARIPAAAGPAFDAPLPAASAEPSERTEPIFVSEFNWRSSDETGAYALDLPARDPPAPEALATDLIEPLPPVTEAPLGDLSFVRDARRKAFWRRPLVRVLLAAITVLLVLILAAQALWQERDRVAVWQPSLKPWLQAMCEPLDCTVGPPRQIEAVAIDSSTFVKLRDDAYRLTLGLRNLGTTAVAMPAIELTLTDAQEQLVLRRVLSPAELGASTDALAGSAEWTGTVAFNAPARVAGYRVLAFYP